MGCIMANNITKALLIVLCMHLVVYAVGFELVDVNSFVNRLVDDPQQNLRVSDELQDSLPDDFEESGINVPGLLLVDGLRAIITFIGFLINIVFAPVALINSLGLPTQSNLLISIPLLIVYIVGVVSLIRGGA
jgi:hypothetical protein